MAIKHYVNGNININCYLIILLSNERIFSLLVIAFL